MFCQMTSTCFLQSNSAGSFAEPAVRLMKIKTHGDLQSSYFFILFENKLSGILSAFVAPIHRKKHDCVHHAFPVCLEHVAMDLLFEFKH